jgi:hypothetical protein
LGQCLEKMEDMASGSFRICWFWRSSLFMGDLRHYPNRRWYLWGFVLATLFHMASLWGNANSHKYLVIRRRFGETISTRAVPSTPHLTEPMIFAVSIKAFGFVIEGFRARDYSLL